MASDVLPENWRLSTLGEVADPNSRAVVSGPFGSNIGSRFFVEQGVPVIRGNNLTTDMTRFVDDGLSSLQRQKLIIQQRIGLTASLRPPTSGRRSKISCGSATSRSYVNATACVRNVRLPARSAPASPGAILRPCFTDQPVLCVQQALNVLDHVNSPGRAAAEVAQGRAAHTPAEESRAGAVLRGVAGAVVAALSEPRHRGRPGDRGADRAGQADARGGPAR
jgi:hypothetical protein